MLEVEIFDKVGTETTQILRLCLVLQIFFASAYAKKYLKKGGGGGYKEK